MSTDGVDGQLRHPRRHGRTGPRWRSCTRDGRSRRRWRASAGPRPAPDRTGAARADRAGSHAAGRPRRGRAHARPAVGGRALGEGPAALGRTTSPRSGRRTGGARGGVTVLLVLEAGDLHEDEAALRLADAVRGPGLDARGPSESRVDLVAAAAGVLHVRVRDVERLDRIDPLEVFTALDGSVVAAGQLVASVKVAPHVVPAAVIDAGAAIAQRRRGGRWCGSRRSSRCAWASS